MSIKKQSRYVRDGIKKEALRLYFKVGLSVEEILLLHPGPSSRTAYYWISSYRKKYFSKNQTVIYKMDTLKDVKPSKGFKTSKQELLYLRTAMRIPLLIEELKKKGKIRF